MKCCGSPSPTPSPSHSASSHWVLSGSFCSWQTIAAVLYFFLSPQETEISTRRKECEALEAEVKKKNQTCQTLVSAPKIYLDLWVKGWRLKLISTWEPCLLSSHTNVPWENEWQSTVMTARFSGVDDWNWKIGTVNYKLQCLWAGMCLRWEYIGKWQIHFIVVIIFCVIVHKKRKCRVWRYDVQYLYESVQRKGYPQAVATLVYIQSWRSVHHTAVNSTVYVLFFFSL